jgi:hypothetical protein
MWKREKEIKDKRKKRPCVTYILECQFFADVKVELQIVHVQVEDLIVQ